MFKQLTTQELIQYIRNFKFTRKITQYHVHHTWKPDYSNFTGKNHQQLQQGMKDYHTKTNGWRDIAQHITLYPDGIWLLGRDLNLNPASITGWNTGAICLEMIGNFDKGKDKMTEAQKQAVLEFSNFITKELGLVMKFHRDSPTAGKTCPGTGIDRDTFFKEVANFKPKVKTETNQVRVLADWEKQVFEECLSKGIIKDESWINKPDEKLSVIYVLSMLNNLYENLKKEFNNNNINKE
jgi:hypothetical protein